MSIREWKSGLAGGAIAGTLILAAAVSDSGAGPAGVPVVSFTIDAAPAPTYAVFSDTAVTGTHEYKDYRLGAGTESDLNYCVDADASRSLFVRLNRKLDGESGVERCDTVDDLYGTGRQRQYLLEIRSGPACAELGANGYLPNAPSWTSPCVITGGVNPRIRLGSLFGKNARFNGTAGLGISWRLSRRINIALEDRMIFMRDDLLDGQRWTEQPLGDAALTRNFDAINWLSLGLNFNLF